MKRPSCCPQLNERTAELREVLEEQTATAVVLQVYDFVARQSRAGVEVMLEKAMRLCQAVRRHPAH